MEYSPAMTLEIALLFGLLLAMSYFFFTEKLPIELTAFLGLIALVLGGYLEAGEAFQGFSSPAVITMISIFFLSAALLRTGVADWIGTLVERTVGRRESALIAVIMLFSGLMSAFMNNIAAAAVLLPAVASIARKTHISPSRLFMPLSFGAILGGTTTLVGTPPNILAGEFLTGRGLPPFQLFDFAPVGLLLLLAGILYMLTLGRMLLPPSTVATAGAIRRDLPMEYEIQDAIFTLTLPPGSRLSGCSLAESQLGATLGVQVVTVRRGAERILAPDAQTVLRTGDLLDVRGRFSDLQGLFDMGGVEIVEGNGEDVTEALRHLRWVVGRVLPHADFVGQTLRDIRFRKLGAVALGIRRDGETLADDPAGIALREGDLVLALTSPDRIEEVALSRSLEITQVDHAVLEELENRLFLLHCPSGSPLAGRTLEDARVGELTGATVVAIVRDGSPVLGIGAKSGIQEGDLLVVSGEQVRLRRLHDLGTLELKSRPDSLWLESEDVGVVEATLAPRSRAAGRTLKELDFRDKSGLQVLAVWREGQSLSDRLDTLRLRLGDALLLQGPWANIRLMGTDPDFLVLSPEATEIRRTRRAPFAVAGLALMILLVVTGYQPIHVAAFIAASFVVLFRTVTMEEAYRAVEWRAVFLVAAILPVGIAMERTGAAALLSNSMIEVAGPLGNYGILGALLVLSSGLSQCLDGAPAVVLLAPVVMEASERLQISPHTLLMGVSLAASAAFMTPFSHKANLLVMGAGGYRMRDYLRVGTPLTVVVLVIMVVLVPVFFPFNR